ncbi:MAG: hypothetical protein C4334_12195 [Pyrinomonas sp.]|uniref:hypothetical protein n=1 Tax=Pyrinomonas sp. TaxID=2080306 RepID=UPI0033232F65
MANAFRLLLTFAACLSVPPAHAQTERGQKSEPTAQSAPSPARKWELVWQDEFNGRRAEAPDDTTQFPQRMLVDYVRVYQREAK